MAKELKIERDQKGFRIFLDGVEVQHVCGFTLRTEPRKVPILTIDIAIMKDQIEVRL